MIRTIKPYGSISLNVIESIYERYGKFYALDRYGKWQISEQDFYLLVDKGFSIYEPRKHSAT